VHDWQAIVTDYGPVVWQTAYRLLGHHADTADCFQETFLAAFEVSCRQPVRNVPGLLVRLATTRAIDRLRQKNRHEKHQEDAPDRCDCTSDRPDPASHLQTREQTWQLRQAIGQLPPQEAKIFCLRYLSEMSYRQIARELNMRVNAVGVSLHRARAKLREALGAAELEEDEVPNGTR
jgi:RNA polymerase sigma-70 factor (ECF subfamily)